MKSDISKFSYNPETGDVTGPSGKILRAKTGLGYLMTYVGGKSTLIHRLAWRIHYGRWPTEIDHINGDRGDNRIINLREVTRAENLKNKRPYKCSVYPGVWWQKDRSTWRIRVGIKYIGQSDNLLDAVALRKTKEVEFGYHKNHGRKIQSTFITSEK